MMGSRQEKQREIAAAIHYTEQLGAHVRECFNAWPEADIEMFHERLRGVGLGKLSPSAMASMPRHCQGMLWALSEYALVTFTISDLEEELRNE